MFCFVLSLFVCFFAVVITDVVVVVVVMAFVIRHCHGHSLLSMVLAVVIVVITVIVVIVIIVIVVIVIIVIVVIVVIIVVIVVIVGVVGHSLSSKAGIGGKQLDARMASRGRHPCRSQSTWEQSRCGLRWSKLRKVTSGKFQSSKVISCWNLVRIVICRSGRELELTVFVCSSCLLFVCVCSLQFVCHHGEVCSDGVTDNLTSAEIKACLRFCVQVNGWSPAQTARPLCEGRSKKTDVKPDDITAVVAYVQ